MLWGLLFGCNRDGCFDANVEDWCHDEGSEDSVNAGGTCEQASGEPTYQCANFDVVENSDGLYGNAHYFDRATGEHVATEYWSDVNEYCGGFASWYGERIDCEPTCTYGEKRSDLPPCDGGT